MIALANKHEQLHLYVDDAHGMSWSGKNGRGYILGKTPIHEKMIVAVSANKAFAAAGGVLIFPNEELRWKVRASGETLLFSGPVQPPMLGAGVASAKLHLSGEVAELQKELWERTKYCNRIPKSA